jgi:hypothetical protein
MKTLLLFGSAQMDAFCPHCGKSLEHRPGKTAEIVLPFFGRSARARPPGIQHGHAVAPVVAGSGAGAGTVRGRAR